MNAYFWKASLEKITRHTFFFCFFFFVGEPQIKLDRNVSVFGEGFALFRLTFRVLNIQRTFQIRAEHLANKRTYEISDRPVVCFDFFSVGNKSRWYLDICTFGLHFSFFLCTYVINCIRVGKIGECSQQKKNSVHICIS